MKKAHYFAVGPAIFDEVTDEAKLIASAVEWLISSRNADGTWGGTDSLDHFITTNHVVMSLLALGFTHKSELLRPAVDYLLQLEPNTQVSFFWRSGALLNIRDFQAIVKSDMEYLWKFRNRVGAHKDYPVFFFLLKLMRFADPKPSLSFNEKDVLKLILRDWTDEDCWYGRTSTTSMALTLIWDLNFRGKKHIVPIAHRFLKHAYVLERDGTAHFSENLVDDCFTVYNLCERKYIDRSESTALRFEVASVIKRIIRECKDGQYWESEPPFGGNIGSKIYPTAVVIRALLSYYMRLDPFILLQIASVLLDRRVIDITKLRQEIFNIAPFWGELSTTSPTNTCFILMPFTKKLTEIYQRYIKKPIESKTGLRCVRADDFYKSANIMEDIWKGINDAQIVIADMTTKNPNVFYELGMAHTLGKETILISSTIDDVPFDLRPIRTILYGDSPGEYEHLTAQLLKYVTEAVGPTRR